MKENIIQKIHVIQYLPKITIESGGLARFVLDLCSVLSDHGVNVTVLTRNALDIPEEWYSNEQLPNVFVIEENYLFGGFLRKKSLSKISKLFTKNSVINLHTPWFTSNVQLARLANKHKVPYVVTSHGSLDVWPMSQKKFKKTVYLYLFARKLMKMSSCMHYTAINERTQAEIYIKKESTQVIPCLFDTSTYVNLPDKNIALNKFKKLSNTKPNILFLSRLHPKKGADVLIKATKILLDKGIEINVILAGPDDPSLMDYRESLGVLVEKNNLSESVHFVGMVQGDEQLSLYMNADLFVLPTHQENFGFVLVEAMACSTPVITSFGVDIYEELQQGGASIVNNTPEEFSDAIESVLKNNALEALGNQARDWVFSELNSTRIGEKYISMYTEVINKNY